MIKAVIFDLDGVLVRTDDLHYKAWKRLGEEIGINNFSIEDNKRQRGVSRMKSLEILLEKSGKDYTHEEKLELAERKNRYYKKLLSSLSGADVLHGARELLLYLRAHGIKTAVGSASANAAVILEKTGLLPLLDAVVCGTDITHSKPNPQVFQLAAEKLEMPCQNCLVVEDADAGVEAAKSGGMKVLAVGSARENSAADFSADNLASVIQSISD